MKDVDSVEVVSAENTVVNLMLMVMGPGGSGKSRLAARLAQAGSNHQPPLGEGCGLDDTSTTFVSQSFDCNIEEASHNAGVWRVAVTTSPPGIKFIVGDAAVTLRDAAKALDNIELAAEDAVPGVQTVVLFCVPFRLGVRADPLINNSLIAMTSQIKKMKLRFNTIICVTFEGPTSTYISKERMNVLLSASMIPSMREAFSALVEAVDGRLTFFDLDNEDSPRFLVSVLDTAKKAQFKSVPKVGTVLHKDLEKISGVFTLADIKGRMVDNAIFPWAPNPVVPEDPPYHGTGSHVLLIGPAGCGKDTIARAMTSNQFADHVDGLAKAAYSTPVFHKIIGSPGSVAALVTNTPPFTTGDNFISNAGFKTAVEGQPPVHLFLLVIPFRFGMRCSAAFELLFLAMCDLVETMPLIQRRCAVCVTWCRSEWVRDRWTNAAHGADHVPHDELIERMLHHATEDAKTAFKKLVLLTSHREAITFEITSRGLDGENAALQRIVISTLIDHHAKYVAHTPYKPDEAVKACKTMKDRHQGRGCFPASSRVLVVDRTSASRRFEVSCKELPWRSAAVSVLAIHNSSGALCADAIAGWGHCEEETLHWFVEITTSNGRTLRISQNHLLPVCVGGLTTFPDRTLKCAGEVKVGDVLLSVGEKGGPQPCEVQQVKEVCDRGLYHFYAEENTLCVVDGVVVSTFTRSSWAPTLLQPLIRLGVRLGTPITPVVHATSMVVHTLERLLTSMRNWRKRVPTESPSPSWAE